MFQKLFNPDNALMLTMSQITDCIFLSFFWVVGCFPVVTAGASFAALYDASLRAFRKGEKNSWQRFLQVFSDNWKAGILPTLVFLAAAAVLGWVMIQLWNAAVTGVLSWGIFAGGAVVGAAVLGGLSLLFPVLSRFENSFAGLLRNTALLALANLPRTVCLGALNFGCVYLCVRWVFPVFFLPALGALLGSLFIEPMFKPFLPSEDAA